MQCFFDADEGRRAESWESGFVRMCLLVALRNSYCRVYSGLSPDPFLPTMDQRASQSGSSHERRSTQRLRENVNLVLTEEAPGSQALLVQFLDRPSLHDVLRCIDCVVPEKDSLRAVAGPLFSRPEESPSGLAMVFDLIDSASDNDLAEAPSNHPTGALKTELVDPGTIAVVSKH